MGTESLVSNLKKVGWKDFAPGEFINIEFEQIGKTKLARNNWFVLIKSLPVLNRSTMESWNANYAKFYKKSQAGMFSSGKYFVLMLLVDTISPDALTEISQEGPPDFLVMPGDIFRGGGFTLMLVKDIGRVFLPKKVTVSHYLKAIDFVKNTIAALEDFQKSLAGEA